MLKKLISLGCLLLVSSLSMAAVDVKNTKDEIVLSNEFYKITVSPQWGGLVKSIKYLPENTEIIARWKPRFARKTGELITYSGGALRDFPEGSWHSSSGSEPYKTEIVRNTDSIAIRLSKKFQDTRLKGVVVTKTIALDNSEKIHFGIELKNESKVSQPFSLKLHNELKWGNAGESLYLIPAKTGLESIFYNPAKGFLHGNNILDLKGDWLGVINLAKQNLLMVEFVNKKIKSQAALFWLTSGIRSFEWIYQKFEIQPEKTMKLRFDMSVIPLGDKYQNLVERKLLTANQVELIDDKIEKVSLKIKSYVPDKEDIERGFFVARQSKSSIKLGNEKILPDAVRKKLSLDVAQGEKTGIMFAVKALRNIKIDSVKVVHSSLDKTTHFDPRLVKVWWQGGNPEKQFLTPELLIHDDSIIKVGNKNNTLCFSKGLPLDPSFLRPFQIEKGKFKQIWLTVEISPKQQPGIYKNYIIVETQKDKLKIPLKIRVFPFKLSPNTRAAGMFVRQQIDTEKSRNERKKNGYLPLAWSNANRKGEKSSKYAEFMPEKQYRQMLKMLKKYGLRDNVIYDNANTLTVIKMHEELFGDSFDKATLILMNPGPIKKYKRETSAKFRIAAWGGDEPHNAEQYKVVKKRIESLKKAYGLPVAVTFAGLGADKNLGKDVAFPVYSVEAAVPYIEKVSKRNKQLGRLTLGYLQTWKEDYLRNRIVYGLYHWKAGYDGIISYVWIDVKAGKKPGPVAYDDTKSYLNGKRQTERNLMMAYPAVNGFIPTLQLEGVRDGINDLRYIETLEELISKNKNFELARTAADFLENFKRNLPASYSSLYNNWDDEKFERFRLQFAKWIIKLKQAGN